jgi:hypothetical protein
MISLSVDKIFLFYQTFLDHLYENIIHENSTMTFNIYKSQYNKGLSHYFNQDQVKIDKYFFKNLAVETSELLIVSFNDSKNKAQFYKNNRLFIFDKSNNILAKGGYLIGGKKIVLDSGKSFESNFVLEKKIGINFPEVLHAISITIVTILHIGIEKEKLQVARENQANDLAIAKENAKGRAKKSK